MPTTTPPDVKPRPAYPRPRLVHDHRDLFVEPTYEDGQPYQDDDDLEDDGPDA